MMENCDNLDGEVAGLGKYFTVMIANIGTAGGYGRADLWLDGILYARKGPWLLNPTPSAATGTSTGVSWHSEAGQHTLAWAVVPVQKVGNGYDDLDGTVYGNCSFVTQDLPEDAVAIIRPGDVMMENCDNLDGEVAGLGKYFTVMIANIGTAGGYGRADLWLDGILYARKGPWLLNPTPSAATGTSTGVSWHSEAGQHTLAWAVVPVQKVGNGYDDLDGTVYGNCSFVTQDLPEGGG